MGKNGDGQQYKRKIILNVLSKVSILKRFDQTWYLTHNELDIVGVSDYA
jgi:hypothetical protein